MVESLLDRSSLHSCLCGYSRGNGLGLKSKLNSQLRNPFVETMDRYTLRDDDIIALVCLDVYLCVL